jgi:hypothetical protein
VLGLPLAEALQAAEARLARMQSCGRRRGGDVRRGSDVAKPVARIRGRMANAIVRPDVRRSRLWSSVPPDGLG